MDSADRKILENEIAVPVGKAISQWVRKNGIEDPVSVQVTVTHPTCYIDEVGVSHAGRLIVCNAEIMDMDDYNDD